MNRIDKIDNCYLPKHGGIKKITYTKVIRKRQYVEDKDKYITLWNLSHIINIHNQTLYNWKAKNKIKPDKIDKNGYSYYLKDTINIWFNNMNKSIVI